MKCVFSIDVEDWFHILDVPSTPDMPAWNMLPSRVERNFSCLLDMLSEQKRRATCFFLGWVADRFPHLVRDAVSRGHEVGSHGYSHRLVFEMDPKQFQEDAIRSKEAIENAAGQRVVGYRAPGFSVTSQTPWFFERLAEAGYEYDSSVFPAHRGHGGVPGSTYSPYLIGNESGIVEFPISVLAVFGQPFCFFGGGYLRLFPYSVVKMAAQKVLSQGRILNFYVHPREIDPTHPRLKMSGKRRFQSYFNLSSTEAKLRKLFADFETSTFQECLESQRRRSTVCAMELGMVQ